MKEVICNLTNKPCPYGSCKEGYDICPEAINARIADDFWLKKEMEVRQ